MEKRKLKELIVETFEGILCRSSSYSFHGLQIFTRYREDLQKHRLRGIDAKLVLLTLSK